MLDGFVPLVLWPCPALAKTLRTKGSPFPGLGFSLISVHSQLRIFLEGRTGERPPGTHSIDLPAEPGNPSSDSLCLVFRKEANHPDAGRANLPSGWDHTSAVTP